MKTQMNKTDLQVFRIPIDRRRFFKSMALASAGFTLPGCLAEALTTSPVVTQGPYYPLANNIPLDKRIGVHAATCYMHLGMREEALKALEASYQIRGRDVSLWLPIREEFDPLQSDPRFQKMLEGMGIPVDSGFPHRGS